MPAFDIPEPIELTTFYNVLPDQKFHIRDIQGAFTRFAVFTDSGNIIMGTEEFLDAFHHAYTTSSSDAPIPLPPPSIIPSLQSKTIISLAFGDHHFHALHGNGTVTSYGQELRRCGALGLGERVESTLRGVYVQNIGFGNGRLPDGEGRTVWFDPLMEAWLQDLGTKAVVDVEAKERLSMLNSGHVGAREAFANYFESEGAKWEEDVTKKGEMGAYFVLKVAAAGWHSAALVLVDDEKAEKARAAHVLEPPPAKSRDPSPAGSLQSNDSYVHIDSPGEQLTNAVYAFYEWVREFGRWFLGLTQRDAAREAAVQHENNGTKRPDEGPRPTYTWTNHPFPRLRLPDGGIMPGEIPLTE
jgi:SCF-associated factor 1